MSNKFKAKKLTRIIIKETVYRDVISKIKLMAGYYKA